MAFDLSKFLAKFIDEAKDHINKLNDGLLALEKNPGDTETINDIFRSAHTIKGASKMMKLTSINELSHKIEDTLDALRKNNVQLTKEMSDVLFRAIDSLSLLIDKADKGEQAPLVDSRIVEDLEKAATGQLTASSTSGLTADLTADLTELADTDAANRAITGVVIQAATHTTAQPAPVEPDLQQNALVSEVMPTGETSSAREASKEVPEKATPQPTSPISTPALPSSSVSASSIPASPASTPPLPAPAQPDHHAPAAKAPREHVGKAKPQETLRISAGKLDELFNQINEIVSNQVRLKQRLNEVRNLVRKSKKHLDLVTGITTELPVESTGRQGAFDDLAESSQTIYTSLKDVLFSMNDDVTFQGILNDMLQQIVLRLRMVPLSTVFDTFGRTIRDMSRSMGKDVDLVIEGAETELDKKLVEQIGDPLMHILRNSIDHGIEPPRERKAVGKPEMGTIRMCAYTEAGNVVIEVHDDGNGIPVAKIREKALQKKYFDADTLNRMSDSEITDIIFYPGFSTSPIITDISGRGVGMDVVRKNVVEQLKGSITIDTNEGKGTSMFIRIPMTLSIMRLMVIKVSGSLFAIPTSSIRELLRRDADELIDVVDKKALRLREQLVPVERLHSIVNLHYEERRELLILIVHIGNERLGLIIDSVEDEEDMVIKPLPEHLKKLRIVSGVTISGKNEIINLLNVPTIIEAAKDVKYAREMGESKEEMARSYTILVVDDSINTREIEKSILESYGYTVTLAGDGIEALEKTREGQFDLVVTDVEMPRLDGFSLTKQLREDANYKHTPIVIVTSREKEEDKRKGIEVGANAYIVKGDFDQSNLIQTIENLL
ncbi:MAG: hybrid sensor histidine kinase/response regulator [Nitrospirae bacterium]|nr:hybrid sensor histidine kinase/response regulator [Nitrospirota bacterium]